MATVTRRTETCTRAPILSSLRRMVPAVARATGGRQRDPAQAASSTQAIDANDKRSWLDRMARVEVRSANRSSRDSRVRFSISLRAQ